VTVRHFHVSLSLSLYVCVCVCARACACAHVYVTYTHSLIQSPSSLCVRLIDDDSLYCKSAPFSVCCLHLAVPRAVGGGLASSAHELLLQRLGAVPAQRGIAAVALGRCVLRPWHLVSLGTLVKRQAAWANGFADGERRDDVGHSSVGHCFVPRAYGL
jgi:hypothetical protein